MTSDIKRVHDLLRDQLDYIDALCRGNDIKYSLHAGTLLGAIRQNGFIAWDDDADLAMSRDDLNKLLAAHNNDHPKFTLERQSLWVYRFSTKGAGEGEHGFLEHANTDVFVFDPAPKNKVLFKAKIVGLLFLQASLKVKTIDLSRGLVWNAAHFIPAIFARLTSRKMKLAMYDGLSQMGAKLGDSAPRHLSNDQYKYLSLTYDAGSLTDHIDHEFEGRKFMVLANWEQVLTKMYGPNYLTPPPVDQQVPMHTLRS